MRSAALVVGDQEVARELARTTFVKALLHWRRVRTYEYPQAWVRKVVFRMALRSKRSTVPPEVVPPPVLDDSRRRRSPASDRSAPADATSHDRAALPRRSPPVDEVAAHARVRVLDHRVHLHQVDNAGLAELLHEDRDDVAH